MDNILKNLLLLIVDDIDSGNSHLSELNLLKAIDFLLKLTSQELSKLESADYLGVSRATFDNYIKKGLIPEGRKDLDSKKNSGINMILIIFINNKQLQLYGKTKRTK